MVRSIVVYAYGFATLFRLKELAPTIEGAHTTMHKDRLIARYENDGMEGLAVLFDFGALVCAGMSEPQRERLLRGLLAHLPHEPHPPLTEDFLVEVRPGHAIEVLFDRVIISEATLPVMEIISLLLAQSVSMDYYAEDVQDILKRTDAIIGSLQTAGRIPGQIADLLKFIGSCIATKNAVITTLSLFDKPDSTWEHRDLDHLYNALRLELELDDRFRALEAKLRMIQENLVLLVDLSRHRSTWRLEMAVVLLILSEVIIMLWQMFRGNGHT